MKKLLSIYGLLIFLASCNALDEKPESQILLENYFKDETSIKAYTNTFYTMFPAGGLYDEQADNIIGQTLSEEVRGVRVVPTSGGGWTWTSLRTVNTYMDYKDNCPDQSVRVKYEALARFFRAYFYFEKVKRFGDVPWYDTQLSSDSDELKKKRDSREFIMQKMLEDIDFAITYLPSSKSLYTVTKWTALALKSRFTLFEGTYRKYHNITQYEHGWEYYLNLCVSASQEFIDRSGYSIYTSGGTAAAYKNMFIDASQASSEVILARNYNPALSVYHGVNYYTLSVSMGRPGLTKKIVDSYLMSNGSRFTDKEGWQTMVFKTEVSGRDTRLAQTIRTPGYTRVNATAMLAPDLSCSATGYHLIKYIGSTDGDAYNKSYNDLIIFRAAEVYLNYAEAKAELGTLVPADLSKTVDKIRARAGLPALDMARANADPDPYLMSAETGYPNVSGSNKGVILEIRRERTIELVMEGFRYYDIMRWREGKLFEKPLYGMYFPGLGEYDLDGNGTMDVCLYKGSYPKTTASVVLQVNKDVYLSEGNSGYIYPGKNEKCVWVDENDRDYLYPIPTDERSLTGGALTQNPGWNDGLSF